MGEKVQEKSSKEKQKAIVKNDNVHLIFCRTVILHHVDIVS